MRWRLQWVELPLLLHPQAVLACPPTLALHRVLGEVSALYHSAFCITSRLNEQINICFSCFCDFLTHTLPFQATPWVSYEISPSSKWCDSWSSRMPPCFLPCCRRSAGKTLSCCRWSTDRARCVSKWREMCSKCGCVGGSWSSLEALESQFTADFTHEVYEVWCSALYKSNVFLKFKKHNLNLDLRLKSKLTSQRYKLEVWGLNTKRCVGGKVSNEGVFEGWWEL